MINYRELFEQIEKRALQDTNIYILFVETDWI